MPRETKWLEQVQVPTLVIREERVRTNIERMANKARKYGLMFRPHFKTHQSATVGAWFRDYGVERITVSSLEMAAYFAGQGWKDITVAFPLNLREIGRVNQLAETTTLSLLVEDDQTVERLSRQLMFPVTLWIKIDSGAGRTGIAPEEMEKIVRLAKKIRQVPRCTLAGILTHAGHTYHAESKGDIVDRHQQSLAKMTAVRKGLEAAGISEVAVSIGDTPGCTLAREFPGADEIRPGNFAYYDLMQLKLGVCRENDIAVAVACPIVAKHPDRNEVVLYGGAVHLSKEKIEDDAGVSHYGLAAKAQKNGWGKILPGCRVDRISQEHGILRTGKTILSDVHVGEVLMILPVHSCLTANLLRFPAQQIVLQHSQPLLRNLR